MIANDDHATHAVARRRSSLGRGGARALRRLVECERLVGWREWLALPQLGIPRIEAKIDTGARTSALHVYDMTLFERHARQVVRFLPPVDERAGERPVEVMVRDIREIRSSSGQTETRCVISTTIIIGNTSFVAEVTLTSREDMTYNMLVGRSALRISRLIVNPTRSYIQGLPQIPR